MRILPISLMPFVLWTATAASASLPIEAQRVALPAQLLHAGKKATLLPRHNLDAGDRIYTGRNGRAALLLEDAGQLVLGDESELYIHSAEPSGEGHGALARMALMRGSLRMDSTARPDKPPQDMRLNVGTLRVRVLGSEVWANVEPGLNQTVCLLQGSVEIVSDVGNETLDNPGDCFRYGSNNVRMRLRPDSDATLARKLSRTAFAGEIPPGTPPVTAAIPLIPNKKPTPLESTPLQAPVEAPAPPPAMPEPVIAPASLAPAPVPPQAPNQQIALESIPLEPASETPAAESDEAGIATSSASPFSSAPPSAEITATQQPAESITDAGNWTVVVASVKSSAGAERESQRLAARGLPVVVHRSNTGFYRVCLGQFGSRELARAYAADLRAREKLSAWVTNAH